MQRSISLWGLVVLAFSLFVGSSFAYNNPKLCQGTCTNAHDPSIIRRDDGTYFRFSTGNKISVHTAPNLYGPWTYKGAVLPSGSTINLKGNNDLWAPDVRKVGNYYYLYYSVSSFGVQRSAICEVWLDHTRELAGFNCHTEFPDSVHDADFTPCGDACRLSWLWLGMKYLPQGIPFHEVAYPQASTNAVCTAHCSSSSPRPCPCLRRPRGNCRRHRCGS